MVRFEFTYKVLSAGQGDYECKIQVTWQCRSAEIGWRCAKFCDRELPLAHSLLYIALGCTGSCNGCQSTKSSYFIFPCRIGWFDQRDDAVAQELNVRKCGCLCSIRCFALPCQTWKEFFILCCHKASNDKDILTCAQVVTHGGKRLSYHTSKRNKMGGKFESAFAWLTIFFFENDVRRPASTQSFCFLTEIRLADNLFLKDSHHTARINWNLDAFSWDIWLTDILFTSLYYLATGMKQKHCSLWQLWFFFCQDTALWQKKVNTFTCHLQAASTKKCCVISVKCLLTGILFVRTLPRFSF